MLWNRHFKVIENVNGPVFDFQSRLSVSGVPHWPSTVHLHNREGSTAGLRSKHFPWGIACMKIKTCFVSSKCHMDRNKWTKKLLCWLVCWLLQMTWWNLEWEWHSGEAFPSSTAVEVEEGVHFSNCFFMMWQSYCRRWGQSRGMGECWCDCWLLWLRGAGDRYSDIDTS